MPCADVRSVTVLELQNTIPEMIATGDTLANTTARMCEAAEKLAPGVICSVLAIDTVGLIHPLAGPSLPEQRWMVSQLAPTPDLAGQLLTFGRR